MSQLLSMLGNNSAFGHAYAAANAQNKQADDYRSLMQQLSNGSPQDQERARQMGGSMPGYQAVPAAPLSAGGFRGLSNPE